MVVPRYTGSVKRVFITGSADGLGRLAAETLLAAGHEVVVHARSEARLRVLDPLIARGAIGVVGDLGDLDATCRLAERVGEMDAVIHNAGVYDVPVTMMVNVVAPYVLTSRMPRARRLVYLSSGMHRGGSARALDGIDFTAPGSYSDSKLFVTAMAMAFARRWPDVIASSVDPGWVPTKMGGPNAPDALADGHRTQEWLAVSDDTAAQVTGGHWHFMERVEPHPAARDPSFQDAVLDALENFVRSHEARTSTV